jgi:hypothetical protein
MPTDLTSSDQIRARAVTGIPNTNFNPCRLRSIDSNFFEEFFPQKFESLESCGWPEKIGNRQDSSNRGCSLGIGSE